MGSTFHLPSKCPPYTAEIVGLTSITTHLTDTTALSFGPHTLFIVLFYLIREEGIKDLVHQRGSGRFSRSLAVLFNLSWVTNGLSSGSSPVDRIKLVFRGEIHLFLHSTPDDMWSDGSMKPLAVNTPQHQAMQHKKQANKTKQTHSRCTMQSSCWMQMAD